MGGWVDVKFWENVPLQEDENTLELLKPDLGGGFKDFYVQHYLGKISNLTNIFQIGWNHQPVINYECDLIIVKTLVPRRSSVFFLWLLVGEGFGTLVNFPKEKLELMNRWTCN